LELAARRGGKKFRFQVAVKIGLDSKKGEETAAYYSIFL
jgi:hypothetical protein